MTDESTPQPDAARLEQEIRRARKFNARDLMAQLAGPGSMKGASPISPVQQAETAITTWLRDNLEDQGGALRTVLHRRLKGSARLLDNLDRPLVALAESCERLLASDSLLRDVVGEADVEWARAMDERPYFEREGAPANPDDPYTLEGVRKALTEAVRLLPRDA